MDQKHCVICQKDGLVTRKVRTQTQAHHGDRKRPPLFFIENQSLALLLSMLSSMLSSKRYVILKLWQKKKHIHVS